MTNVLSSLYVLEIRPLSHVGLVKIFSHSVRPSFCLVGHFLCFTEEAFQFQEVPSINFVSLRVCATGVLFRKRSPVPMRSNAFDIFIFFYCG